ncbi:WS/DGAT domain-containing protein [Sinimarinibacterium flocculans]|uniref:diacylglycerol O-acyltransferase n=1 Tax=Sinimarinibacterium flocculans TaxID=985250 RepID=A0A318EHS1_9GAMM|nr:WS/DGAT domain-containing protein [Sinimarinibacterium flocculans]PXV70365.1 WS/DGAT/MGAT family acyltransferase [Sinimarinibacterium flocculans]
MSAVDRAWLEMDEPNNPMVVSAVLELDRVDDVRRLVQHVVERLVGYPRFRQCVDRSVEPPVWCNVADLSLAYHVRIFHLTEDGPEHCITAAVAREVAGALDQRHPLWQLIVFMRDEGRVTVLFRAHHAIADGMALIGVLMRCTDEPAQPPRDAATEARLAVRRLFARIDRAAGTIQDLVRIARDRARWGEHLAVPLRHGRDTALAFRRVLRLPQDNPSCLRQPLSGERRVAWSGALRLAPVKARARKLGVKVNDLFLAALAGAISRYLKDAQSDGADARNLRISIPVNLRKPVDGELGNCFGLVLLDLPMEPLDWQTRLRLVAQRMQSLKRSPEARATLLGLAAAGRLPIAWEKSLVNYLAGKSAAVVSNLPGPQQALTIAGARLGNLVFWPPQTAGIGVGISLFSYNGRVTVGISADLALIEDPARIVALFEDELRLILQPRKHAAVRELRQPARPTLVRTSSVTDPPPSSDRVRTPDPAHPAQVHHG